MKTQEPVRETKYSGKSLKEVALRDIMRQAFSQHILIPAFNVSYLPMVKPIIDALKALDCFGLVEVARPDGRRKTCRCQNE